MATNKQLLEIDPDLMPHSNLLLNEPGSSKSSDDTVPWKPVKPQPGICIKTRKQDGEKVFINLCHTKDIPAPRSIDEAELLKILESDQPGSYKIAMSLADAHIEADKGGNPCLVYDVAINSDFFKKVESSKLFKRFVFTVVSEGLENKYKFQMDPKADLIELKNRRVMGILQYHRIEQRPINYGDPVKPKLLIEELDSVKLETPRSQDNIVILRTPVTGKTDHLRVFVHVKNIETPEVLLGEDRIIVKDLSSVNAAPYVDEFLPCHVQCERALVVNPRPSPNVLEMILPVN
uniref:PIH1 domain-containing protein 1 n=1 Tax=Cacopsylla melanoneura TaxID=428564 RepID=A0A8D8PLA4_9HEMI